MPFGAPTKAEAVRCGAEVFRALGQILHERGLPTLVGDEGGYAPPLETPQQALDLIVEAIERAGYKPGDDVAIALDPAVERVLFATGKYYPLSRDHAANVDEMIALYKDLCNRYPIVSIEDGLAEERLGRLGDAHRRARQARAARRRRSLRHEHELLARGIKRRRRQRDPDQAQPDRHAHRNARLHRDGPKAGYGIVISHRSGETEDTTIADLAVATGAGQIKTGSLVAQRPHGKVQSADGDRRAARAGSALSRGQGLRTRACSSAVERPAHNWLRVGSNPTRPNIKWRFTRTNQCDAFLQFAGTRRYRSTRDSAIASHIAATISVTRRERWPQTWQRIPARRYAGTYQNRRLERSCGFLSDLHGLVPETSKRRDGGEVTGKFRAPALRYRAQPLLSGGDRAFSNHQHYKYAGTSRRLPYRLP